jgi:hypothetical protein
MQATFAFEWVLEWMLYFVEIIAHRMKKCDYSPRRSKVFQRAL